MCDCRCLPPTLLHIDSPLILGLLWTKFAFLDRDFDIPYR